MPNSERTTVAGKIAAHLDVGTVVLAVVGFLMAFLLNSAVSKIDRLADGVASLNEKMVSVLLRWEYQEKRDAVQDEILMRQSEIMQRIETRVLMLEK